MSLTEQTITYEQIISWGAHHLYSEKHLKKWFGKKPSVSLKDGLEKTLEPSLLFWVIMRTEVLPARVIHQLAVDLCRFFHDRMEKDGVYIDFRSRKTLAAKEEWISGKVSLGILRHNLRKAMRARDDVLELEDDKVDIAAELACQALLDNPRDAFRGVFYTFLHYDNATKTKTAIHEFVAERLKAYEGSPAKKAKSKKSKKGGK